MKTTILVEMSTRQKLKNFGRKGQSYDEVLNQMMIDAQKNMGPLARSNELSRVKDNE